MQVSLVVLNKTRFDDKSFFRTIAAIDVIQSTECHWYYWEVIKTKSTRDEFIRLNQSLRFQARRISLRVFTTSNSKEYNIVKQEAFKWERKKKYREALQFFRSGFLS